MTMQLKLYLSREDLLSFTVLIDDYLEEKKP